MANYLIGFGERLTRTIKINGGGGEKTFQWTFEEARARLKPRWEKAASDIEELTASACPNGQTVLSLLMHPDFLARSYYPSGLLRELDLRAVGSRARPVHIDKGEPRKGHVKPHTAPELFVAGDRKRIVEFASQLATWRPSTEIASKDFRKIQDIASLDLTRLRAIEVDPDGSVPLEVVLHASDDEADDFIVKGFEVHAGELGVAVNLEQRLHVGGLCFLPVRAPATQLAHLAAYSFVRVIRRMPKLTLNEAVLTTAGMLGGFPVLLPSKPALNPDIQVAIFDGGVPENSPVAPWVRPRDAVGVGPALPALQAHGLAVTSALLFGSLEAGKEAPQPYANVDHWRVLDGDIADDDFELIGVLRRILNVLRQRKYDFVSLSIGPALPMEDDEVHVWTSSLDAYLSANETVLAVACGNTGALDWASGNARIQPSADGVNSIGIGSATTYAPAWQRAPYSSIGPGRSPGFVKPDFVAFGGCDSEPFWLLDFHNPGQSAAKMGTSYAAPNGVRPGVGVRAHFGGQLSASAIRALLVHHSSREDHEQREVGWGRVPADTSELVVCEDGSVTVVYQGTLEPSQHMRFPIAVPRDPFQFDVTIKATFCIFTPIDPEDSLNYTRAGLGPTFRPVTVGHPGFTATGKVRSVHPSAPFFAPSDFYRPELTRRRDGHKWETTLRSQKKFRPGQLNQPAFDVEHHARIHGAPAARRTDIRYALVVSVSSEHEPDLFNRTLANYPTTLQILRPSIEVPVIVKP